MSSKVDKQKIINNLEKTPNWNDAGNSYSVGVGGWVGILFFSPTRLYSTTWI